MCLCMLYLAGLYPSEVRDALDVNEHPLKGPVMVHASPSVASNQPEVIWLIGILLQHAEELWQRLGCQVQLAI